MEHWQSFLALVNMIMFCTGIPGHYPVNETTSSLTLTFWYTLQVSGHRGAACPDPALQAGPEAPGHGDWGLAWLRLVPRDFQCPCSLPYTCSHRRARNSETLDLWLAFSTPSLPWKSEPAFKGLVNITN